MHPFLLRSRSVTLALVGIGSTLSLIACGSDSATPSNDPGSLPTGFGGSSGAVAAVPSGGAGASSGSGGQAGEMTTLPAVCLNVAQGQLARIDDFEDGDSVALPEPGREGYWFTVHDTTTGSIVPDTDFIPVPGGANGTQRAAHVQASGFSEWGALFEVSLTYLSDGVHCPYNAAGFAGVRFFLRGSGIIRVALVTPADQAKEFGGNCDPNAGMVCYDTHTTSVTLSDQWTLYELPWSLFKQRGFGAPAVFQQNALMALQFAFDTPDLPVDFWLDEVSFWDGKATPAPIGEGGAGGADAAGAGGDGPVGASDAGAGGVGGHADP
ncbi:MAG: hypothetical protein ABUL62_32530 [Myxococcales bacterium]